MALAFICIVGALLSFLNLLALWYRKQPDSQNRSIRGVVQLIQIFIVLGAFIMVASMLVNKSPVMLLSGLGAVAAVLILIFQDTILALVSGIQLSTNHMIRLGDWIELPSENVDGVIIDIALHTVKVQNWDMTIVTVPTRKLTVETFMLSSACASRDIESSFFDIQMENIHLKNELENLRKQMNR